MGVRMGSRPVDRTDGRDQATTIRRLTGDGARWRVRVESWRVGDEFQGRIVFEPDGPASRTEPRVGPARLRGRSREDLLSSAYDLSEQWLRELLHALG